MNRKNITKTSKKYKKKRLKKQKMIKKYQKLKTLQKYKSKFQHNAINLNCDKNVLIVYI